MDLGKGIKDGGGYDLSELDNLEKQMSATEASGKDIYKETEPMYIPVIPNGSVARTEEYESRMVVVEYDEYDNIVGVELL